MMSSSAYEQEVAQKYPSSGKERQAIRAQMEKILASPHFRQSKRYPVLLRYVVELTLEGREAELKERTLGVEVFQREADYDTNQDPVVRITAGEVRKRIAQYYHDAGHIHEPRIDLPAGSYVPQFRLAPDERPDASPDWNEAVSAPPATVAALAAPVTALAAPAEPANKVLGVERKSWLRWWHPTASWVWVVMAAIAAVAIAGWYLYGRQRAEAEAIWTPLLTSTPLLISIGEPSLAYDADPAVKSGQLTVREHLREVDYMAFSDVQALTRVTAVLDAHRHPYRLLPASATTYADLRQGPALLLGGFDNPWTMRAISKLRYRLVRKKGDDQLWIEDEKDPQSRKWAVNFSQNYDALVEDYAIVARFVDPDTHQPVIVMAGIGENGTKAASEFLTDPSSEALRVLTDAVRRSGGGKDGMVQNFEAVIKTQVINGVSGPPLIVAKEVW